MLLSFYPHTGVQIPLELPPSIQKKRSMLDPKNSSHPTKSDKRNYYYFIVIMDRFERCLPSFFKYLCKTPDDDDNVSMTIIYFLYEIRLDTLDKN